VFPKLVLAPLQLDVLPVPAGRSCPLPHYRVADDLNYPMLQARYYTDTMFAKTRSIRDYSMGQVLTDSQGDTHFVFIKSVSEDAFSVDRPVTTIERTVLPNIQIYSGRNCGSINHILRER
jgi:hypothetical protein